MLVDARSSWSFAAAFRGNLTQEIPNPAAKGDCLLIYIKAFMIEARFHSSIMSMSRSMSKSCYPPSICSNSTQRLL